MHDEPFLTAPVDVLVRIADALDRLAPPPLPAPDFSAGDAFTWVAGANRFEPVARVNRMPISLLRAIDRQAGQLLDNTLRFARGLPANNALLWGARGMGKSSLVKAVHAEVGARGDLAQPLKLVEIHREDIATLPECLKHMRGAGAHFLIFCDDLSFDNDDTSYKSLKAVLEGGIEGRPANVVFYATSNRRHLMPRDMSENEQATALHPGEAVEENVSLSDRFGLWLGFHKCSQEDYLLMIERYMAYYGLNENWETVRTQALAWATQRGARSGRVAWQFIQDLAGRLGRTL